MQLILKAFAALLAKTAFSSDGLSSATTPVHAWEEETGVLSEDLEENMDFDGSMSMSMPYYDDTFDCSALQQMWNDDPRSIEGSDLLFVKEDCDKGLISTAVEVAEAIEAYEGSYQPSIEEQFATLAENVCTHALKEMDGGDFEEIQDACEENPRDDEKVVDTLARFVSKQSPEGEGKSFYELHLLHLITFTNALWQYLIN